MSETEGLADGKGDTDPKQRSGVVFICDASAEADRLQAALRGRGYPVVDVPLGHMPTRVRYERPEIVVLDADGANLEALIQQATRADPQTRLVLLGESSLEPELSSPETLAQKIYFRRPIDVEQVAQELAGLLGPPPERPAWKRASRAPVLMAATRRPVRGDSPNLQSGGRSPLDSQPPLSAIPSIAPIIRDSTYPLAPRSKPLSSRQPPPERTSLSAETRALLEQGRRKIRAHVPQSSRPTRLGTSSDAALETDSAFLKELGEPLELEENDRAPSHRPAPPPGLGDTKDSEPSVTGAEHTQAGDPEEATNPGGRESPLSGTEAHLALEIPPPEAEPPTTNPGGKRRDSEAEPLEVDDLAVLSTRNAPSVDFRLSNLPELAPSLLPTPAPQAPHPPVSQSAIPSTARGSGLKPHLDTGDATRWGSAKAALGRAIVERTTGSLAQQSASGLRRVLLREGDLITVTSTSESEALIHFLEHRGDLTSDAILTLTNVPRFGRHAAAALIASGHLAQDDLWPILRSHAEWLLGHFLESREPVLYEASPPIRALEEPAVFGGSPGPEVYVECYRRITSPDEALRRLGQGQRAITVGQHRHLLVETGIGDEIATPLSPSDIIALRSRAPGTLVLLAALVELGALSTGGADANDDRDPQRERELSIQMDVDAFRARLQARLRLVDDGDYFSILGVDRGATRYEVDRAFTALVNELDPNRFPAHAHEFEQELERILNVARQAHLVLKDDVRRARYRRALETPPRTPSH